MPNQRGGRAYFVSFLQSGRGAGSFAALCTIFCLFATGLRTFSYGSADFDEKVLARIETEVVHARRNTVRFRLLPLYRAAAVVAIVLGLGFAAQHSFEQNSEEVGVSYNYSDYKDTYSDPQVAYEQVSSALKAMSKGLRDAGLKQLDSTWVKQ